jgi:phosphoglycolate phosphatase
LAKFVIFDCDGTLVDSQATIVAAMERAFSAHGLAPPEAGLIRHQVGLSLERAVANLAPEAGQESLAQLVAGFRRAFTALQREQTLEEPLFGGVVETLDRLDAAGVLAGVATGKRLKGLRITLARHGLADRFVTLQTADRGPGKPHPAMLERALAETGCEAALSCMVGDTTFDIEMAQAAGVRPIGVSWGYHSVAALRAAGAESIIDDMRALPAEIGIEPQ